MPAMLVHPTRLRCLWGGLVLAACSALAQAAPPATPRLLPAEVEALLRREQLPLDAVSVLVQEVGARRSRLAWNIHAPMNPASLVKLLTTYAALDLLGPAWTWATPVWLNGPVRDGVLEGSLVIQGRGDPKLQFERVWLLLRRVQSLGVREIRGDIVLDQSAFAPATGSPAAFDNEPLRPYNASPEALLLSQKAVIYGFTPDAQRGLAFINAEPPLAGVQVDASVPLLPGPCDDWRASLKASFADPARVRFAGAYPLACGDKQWPVAWPEPQAFAGRLLEALWRELGGRLTGTVRTGPAPAGVAPSFELVSPPLAEVVRDINKFSNNVMAQQLFLTLAQQRQGIGTPEAAREMLNLWLLERLGEPLDGVVLDNGSGLSRDTRISAALLARLLQHAWASPVMPELMASLPVNGVDGTLRRWKAGPGRAHLKTGSLRDVAGVAGYVLAASGRRYVLVALVNHPNANAARPALDALVQWAIDEGAR
jgi:D-alanyl-D-alanine carboxypeptidase/D-alanyl-D-alanine-endopeptidase (penicillin-binding protein 4)